MKKLTPTQKTEFLEKGFTRVEQAVSSELLQCLQNSFAGWVEESKQHTGPYGETLDGRPRFDVEPDHSATTPALRRVASPTEICEHYLKAITDSAMIDAVADLVGPNLRFHHSKLNSKLPGTRTVVKWHQDFGFDPHSNDDLVTVLLYLDDVTPASGPPMLIPGSHRGPIHSLWHDGVFTGAVSEEISEQVAEQAVPCTGASGDACLMHTRTLHASTKNASQHPRTLFIFNIGAADAVPLAPCALPSIHEGMLVKGREPGRIRSISFELDTPEIPKGASFFEQQATHIAGKA